MTLTTCYSSAVSASAGDADGCDSGSGDMEAKSKEFAEEGAEVYAKV